jgi:integrase
VLDQAAEGAEERSQLPRLRRVRTVVEVGRSEALALLVVLLGGEAGLRCGEMMALEWTEIDFTKRQLTVARSEWRGHVTMPKGGCIRYVPMTRRLTEALREARHLRGPRVLCDASGKPLTQKVVQVLVRRTARRANVRPGIHILRTRSVRIWRCVERRQEQSRSWPDTRTWALLSATCT